MKSIMNNNLFTISNCILVLSNARNTTNFTIKCLQTDMTSYVEVTHLMSDPTENTNRPVPTCSIELLKGTDNLIQRQGQWIPLAARSEAFVLL